MAVGISLTQWHEVKGLMETYPQAPFLQGFIFYHIFMPSATYFCNDTKVGKKSFPQTPGGLIFREFLQQMLDMKWPASDKAISEDIAKRNRAENHSCIACLSP